MTQSRRKWWVGGLIVVALAVGATMLYLRWRGGGIPKHHRHGAVAIPVDVNADGEQDTVVVYDRGSSPPSYDLIAYAGGKNTVLWRRTLAGKGNLRHWNRPYAVDDKHLYLAFEDNQTSIVAIARSSGSPSWDVGISGRWPFERNPFRAVGDLMLARSRTDNLETIITAVDTSSGKQRWSVKTRSGYGAALVVHSDSVFLGGNQWRVEDGKPVVVEAPKRPLLRTNRQGAVDGAYYAAADTRLWGQATKLYRWSNESKSFVPAQRDGKPILFDSATGLYSVAASLYRGHTITRLEHSRMAEKRPHLASTPFGSRPPNWTLAADVLPPSASGTPFVEPFRYAAYWLRGNSAVIVDLQTGTIVTSAQPRAASYANHRFGRYYLMTTSANKRAIVVFDLEQGSLVRALRFRHPLARYDPRTSPLTIANHKLYGVIYGVRFIADLATGAIEFKNSSELKITDVTAQWRKAAQAAKHPKPVKPTKPVLTGTSTAEAVAHGFVTALASGKLDDAKRYMVSEAACNAAPNGPTKTQCAQLVTKLHAQLEVMLAKGPQRVGVEDLTKVDKMKMSSVYQVRWSGGKTLAIIVFKSADRYYVTLGN